MKKITFVMLLFILNFSTGLFSQSNDSLAKEMERLNRLGDSLHKVQLARDSASRARMNEIMRGAQQDIEKAKQKEVEEATQQVVKQYEKEQGTKRRTMLLAISAFLIAVIAGGIIFRRRNLNAK